MLLDRGIAHLRSVEDIVVAVLLGGHLESESIRSGRRLGESEATELRQAVADQHRTFIPHPLERYISRGLKR